MLLIVDDDPTFLERAQEAAPLEGRGIFFAGNAEHAKDLMGTVGDGFSVVMIDLDLPGQDGFSLISEMRRHFPISRSLRSAASFRSTCWKARSFSAPRILEKPIGPEWTTTIARVRANAAIRSATNSATVEPTADEIVVDQLRVRRDARGRSLPVGPERDPRPGRDTSDPPESPAAAESRAARRCSRRSGCARRTGRHWRP